MDTENAMDAAANAALVKNDVGAGAAAWGAADRDDGARGKRVAKSVDAGDGDGLMRSREARCVWHDCRRRHRRADILVTSIASTQITTKEVMLLTGSRPAQERGRTRRIRTGQCGCAAR